MDRLEFSARLARDAGRLAHTAFGQSATSMKGRHDVLTAMDGEVERFIRKAIVARYPDDAIIGEEEGGRGDDQPGGRRDEELDQSEAARCARALIARAARWGMGPLAAPS